MAALGAQRRGFVEAVLGGPRGGIVLAADWDEALRFVNDYAPEHLEVLSTSRCSIWAGIQHAGEILLGRAHADHPRQFLPRPRLRAADRRLGAHLVAALAVHDFMKRTSIAHVTAAGYPELARHARALATYEGFEAHAKAVSPLRDER